jgi:hypothetical protein
VYRDLADLAMQEMLSNGCAPPTHETLGILRAMHPCGSGTRSMSASGQQVSVSTSQAKVMLFKLAGKRRPSEDCFGWSACLLYPLRGQRTRGRFIPFIQQVARLVSRIACANVPTIFGSILSCGDLLALHKLDAAEQIKAREDGILPSLRPVNKGCNFLKWALKLAVRSPPARAAALSLEPLQSGLAKRGPEAFCHSLRALREKGFAILKLDFRNGFNAISRQAVLDAVQRRCPQLTALMNLFYTVEGACFFIVDDVVETIPSAEGVRMGCPLGSFGFDLALQDVLERCVHSQGAAGVVLRSLTDDCNLALQLPDDPALAHATLVRLHTVLTAFAADAKATLNLDLNLDKCSLLLPPRHSVAPACFNGIRVATRGFKVAGAPIGDDAFCADFIGRRVTEALAKIHTLKGIDPQVGMLLLRLCCMPLLNYLAQVTPPSLTAQHFADFDTQVADFVMQLLTLPGRVSAPCAEDRMRAFRRRLRLPLRHNGAGLVGVDSIAAAAFAGSVIASTYADRVLPLHLGGLARFAQPALSALQARLAPLGAQASNSLLKLPSPVLFLDPSRYVELDSDENPVVPNMQQKWSRSVHDAALHTLIQEEEALGDCDFVHSQARARPAATILQLPLSNSFFRLTPLEFVSWFRFQFRIPQLARIHNADHRGVEQCIAGCRSRDIDLHGNHAHSGTCRATLHGRGLRHRLMKFVVSYHAAKAGCIASMVSEASAPELLLNEFSALQCSTMFHSKPPAVFADKVHALRKDMQAAAALPQDQRAGKLTELRSTLQGLISSVQGGHNVRPDGTILHPLTQSTVWFDVAGVHTTCKSHLKNELKLTRDRRDAGKVGARMMSNRLLEEHRLKLDRYALLAAIAERQCLDGMRPVAPLILPLVATTHGEFCPGVFLLQEWLAEKFRSRLLLEGPLENGEDPDNLTKIFCRDFRASLLVALIKGTVDSLNAAGMPSRKLVSARTPTIPSPAVAPDSVYDTVCE